MKNYQVMVRFNMYAARYYFVRAKTDDDAVYKLHKKLNKNESLATKNLYGNIKDYSAVELKSLDLICETE